MYGISSRQGAASGRQTRRRVAGVVAVMVLFVGTAVGGRALRTAGPPPLLPVPLISQAHPWSCGAAALMAALVYFGVFDEAESVLDVDLHVNPEDGTRVENIVAEARRFGLRAEARVDLSLDDLSRALSRGAVVIAAIQAWPTDKIADWRTDWEDGHYVVVVGLLNDRVYVMDPSVRTGYAYLNRNDFLTRWHDSDVDGDQLVVWNRLGIVIEGGKPIRRYPAEPTPIQ